MNAVCSGSSVSPSRASPEPAAVGARVLMIDDDRKLCRLVAIYLRQAGFQVTAVHTGGEGLDRALRPHETWHAIVLDLMLPGMHGMEVLRRIRMRSAVPVFIYTACGDEAHRPAALNLGATDCLAKSQGELLVARLCELTHE